MVNWRQLDFDSIAADDLVNLDEGVLTGSVEI